MRTPFTAARVMLRTVLRTRGWTPDEIHEALNMAEAGSFAALERGRRAEDADHHDVTAAVREALSESATR